MIFAEFFIGDVEDPEIYAAEPLWQWQQSEAGKFVMEHALETPSFQIMPNMETMGYKVRVYGNLSERDEVFYRLKYK
jgi:hypothetical protein